MKSISGIESYESFNQIIAVRYEVIVILHVTALLDSHEVLHGIQILSNACARQELLVRHRVAQIYGDIVVVWEWDVVALLRLVTTTHLE